MSDEQTTPETLWARYDEILASNPKIAAEYARAHRLDQVPRPATTAPTKTNEPNPETEAYRAAAKTNPIVSARAFLRGEYRK